MKKSEEANGFVIDGFPANLNQGMMIILISCHHRLMPNSANQKAIFKYRWHQKVSKYIFYSQALWTEPGISQSHNQTWGICRPCFSPFGSYLLHPPTSKTTPYPPMLKVVKLWYFRLRAKRIFHDKVSNGVMRSRLLARGNFDDKGETVKTFFINLPWLQRWDGWGASS